AFEQVIGPHCDGDLLALIDVDYRYRFYSTLVLLPVPIFKYVTKNVIPGSRPRCADRLKIMALVSNSRLLGSLTGA
ncbi:MAG: hypothetical protein WAL09_26120, partial [Pseudolabrys sp.]